MHEENLKKEQDTQDELNGLNLKNGELVYVTSKTDADRCKKQTEDRLKPNGGVCAKAVIEFWQNVHAFRSKHSLILQKLMKLALHLTLITYFVAVVIRYVKYHHTLGAIDWCNGTGLLTIIITLIYWSIFYYSILKPWVIPYVRKTLWHPKFKCMFQFLKYCIWLIVIAATAIFIVLDTASDRRRLISLAGLVFFILVGFVFSKHPDHVKWKPVFIGVFLQLGIGFMTIRWNVGRNMIECLGAQIEAFLRYADIGAEFVYGKELIRIHPTFAFQALCSIYFLNFITQILFYYGWMQRICLLFGWFLKSILDTTVVESVYTCASVFLGMNEAPLLVQPYLKYLTMSELHAVMTGGFSTVAGSVFAAYVAAGVNPTHIITASIMSAPAALSYAKLFYPETEYSKTQVHNIEHEKRTDVNVIEAACKGAAAGTELILRIVASVLCFVAFAAFINGCLEWLGYLIGWPDFNMENILGALFVPIALIMGVDPSQSHTVAQLIGIKTSLNEFIAYEKLGELKRANRLSIRSEAIATFALCSFSNPAALGGLIGTLSSLCPEQSHNITRVAVRAIIGSIIVCFITACIAGFLTPENGFENYSY